MLLAILCNDTYNHHTRLDETKVTPHAADQGTPTARLIRYI